MSKETTAKIPVYSRDAGNGQCQNHGRSVREPVRVVFVFQGPKGPVCTTLPSKAGISARHGSPNLVLPDVGRVLGLSVIFFCDFWGLEGLRAVRRLPLVCSLGAWGFKLSGS